MLRGAVERRLAVRVQGWDRRAEVRAAAAESGYGAFIAPTLEAACRGATLAVVAVPVRAIPPLVDRVRRLLGPEGVVTDTGSTKRWVLAEVARLARTDSGGLAPFVGGHPVAGVERSGFAASSGDLFDGRPWVLAEPEGDQAAAAAAALDRVSAFVRGLGATAIVVSAARHDRALAVTSHLPYLLAAALASLAESRLGGPAGTASFAAGGFRDATRLALQDPEMGLDMLWSNADEVGRALADLVEVARRHLSSPADERAAALERARAFRAELGRLKRWS